MRKIRDIDKTLLIKYMIELGIRETDIIYCFAKLGIMGYEPSLLIEALIIGKEVIRDKNNELHLTQKLPPVPKRIAKMIKECMER